MSHSWFCSWATTRWPRWPSQACEGHRGQRVVAHEQNHECDIAPRRQDRSHDREQVDGDHEHRLDDVATELCQASPAGVVGVDRERRAPQHLHGLSREPALLVGVLAPEIEHELAVVALLRALVDLGGLAGKREVGGELGPGRPTTGLGHVVDPAAAVEDLARVLVVRLPERARVGRENGTTDADLVATDPGCDDNGGSCDYPGAEQQGTPRALEWKGDERGEHEREERQPGVTEDREARCRSEREGQQSSLPLRDDEREQRDYREEQPVQDLAVQVHVVPDEERVQRGDRRPDDADPKRGSTSTDLEHDHRGQCCDRDVRQADDQPVTLENLVERGEEPGVEGLGVSRGPPGQEAERSAGDECLREAVALLDELLKDRPPLGEQDYEARHDRGDEHDRKRLPSRHGVAAAR